MVQEFHCACVTGKKRVDHGESKLMAFERRVSEGFQKPQEGAATLAVMLCV